MSTEDIRNYRKVNEQLITGGQPTEEQLVSAATDGFKTIINLAPIDPRYSLPDEKGLAHSLGMSYHHIPVDWQNPTERDFDEFDKLMKQSPAQPTLIHCAANFRVTAFYSLFAMKNLGWSEAQADEFRASVWTGSDYPIWEKFVSMMKEKINHPG